MSSPKKLSLRKETIRALSCAEMQRVIGGVNYAFLRAADAYTGFSNVCTKTCALCAGPLVDAGLARVLPAYNQPRGF